MVWLHGGFFAGSSGSTVDGTQLASQHGAVVVSLNHRLNAFGFTDLSEFGDGFASSANAGMLDIVAALRWIRDNISAFGGDPDRVMVFGTSGGGMKTSVLMASPLAHGLIHRAGVQSGPGIGFLTRSEASEAAERLLREAGLNRSNAADLQALSVEALLGAYHRVTAQLPAARFTDIPCFGPVVDGHLLDRQPFSPDAAAATGGIPMIIGSNTDEMTFFMGNDEAGFAIDEQGFEARVANLAPCDAQRICGHYRAAFPQASPSQQWVRFFSDYSIGLPVRQQAERHAAISGGQTWLYRLGLQSPALSGKLGATHTLETPLIFGNPNSSQLLTRVPSQNLADMMSTAWAGLAENGRPGIMEWQDYSASQGGMAFGQRTEYVPELEKETFSMLAEIFRDP